MDSYVCYFDGLCLPVNPGGISTYGFLVEDSKENLIYEECNFIEEDSTANVAEYNGLYNTLKYLVKEGYKTDEVLIYGDSMLIINQVNKLWKCKSGRLSNLYINCLELKDQLDNVTIKWIGRDHNKKADHLTRVAYMNYTNKDRDFINYEEHLIKNK